MTGTRRTVIRSWRFEISTRRGPPVQLRTGERGGAYNTHARHVGRVAHFRSDLLQSPHTHEQRLSTVARPTSTLIRRFPFCRCPVETRHLAHRNSRCSSFSSIVFFCFNSNRATHSTSPHLGTPLPPRSPSRLLQHNFILNSLVSIRCDIISTNRFIAPNVRDMYRLATNAVSVSTSVPSRSISRSPFRGRELPAGYQRRAAELPKRILSSQT